MKQYIPQDSHLFPTIRTEPTRKDKYDEIGICSRFNFNDLTISFPIIENKNETYFFNEVKIIKSTIKYYMNALSNVKITLQKRQDFETYNAIRRGHSDIHLNQAFDPQHTKFGNRDFWLLAKNQCGEAIATYCLRRFIIDDFYDLIRSQALWFSACPPPADPRFVVACEIPRFGGEIIHGGGLWVRQDYRGFSSKRIFIAFILPRLARAIALRTAPFDHDTGMIRNDPKDSPRLADRKAAFMGRQVYGFARVHRFTDGWFPPESRNAIMYLCHATRAEAVASLVAPDVASSFQSSRASVLATRNMHSPWNRDWTVKPSWS